MFDAAGFVKRFADYWADPTPDGLSEVLHDDVLLVQPLAPTTRGLADARTSFAKLFAWLPDLRGEVDSWGADGDDVYIRFRLSATIGGARIEWPAIDHFVVRGDKGVQRSSYFDTWPLLLHILVRPWAWPGWLRSGVGRPWQRGRVP